MPKKGIAYLFAGILSFCFLIGCQAGQRVLSAEDTVQQYTLVAADPSPVWLAAEYPAADASPLLSTSRASAARPARQEEMRAIWISYLEMAHLLEGNTQAQFTANIASAFDQIAALGLNTVIVQVRPFGDALYDSAVFAWSHTATGVAGKSPGFDPLSVMVAEAKAHGLRIEAWLNPYRIRVAGSDEALSQDDPALSWLYEDDSDVVIQYDGAISYNPASEQAQALIVQGAVEIVESYDVDGIHIDDYFYPTTDAAFDRASYQAYKAEGGKLSLGNWRRANVEALLRKMYNAIKAADPDCLFGISPQSSIDNNYSQQYLDVEKIAGQPGYCDYLCPQIYFGYQNTAQPYQKTLRQWHTLVQDSPVKLYVGLAAYKIGAEDIWAGGGKWEWANHTDQLSRMVQDARQLSNYAGFALYRYDSLFRPEAAVKTEVAEEIANLKAIL